MRNVQLAFAGYKFKQQARSQTRKRPAKSPVEMAAGSPRKRRARTSEAESESKDEFEAVAALEQIKHAGELPVSHPPAMQSNGLLEPSYCNGGHRATLKSVVSSSHTFIPDPESAPLPD